MAELERSSFLLNESVSGKYQNFFTVLKYNSGAHSSVFITEKKNHIYYVIMLRV